jgi:hypothetical protein
MKTLKILLPVIIMSLAACAGVKPHEQAESITLVKPEHVASCKKLATTNVSVTDKVAFIKRGEPAITQDLLNLAKNRAVELGGDTIVEKSPPSEGKASYLIYDCGK